MRCQHPRSKYAQWFSQTIVLITRATHDRLTERTCGAHIVDCTMMRHGECHDVRAVRGLRTVEAGAANLDFALRTRLAFMYRGSVQPALRFARGTVSAVRFASQLEGLPSILAAYVERGWVRDWEQGKYSFLSLWTALI